MGAKYSLQNGGALIDAGRISFELIQAGLGFYKINIDGRTVTTDPIRGCDYPLRIEQEGLKVGMLMWVETGRPTRLAIFANGVVGEWTDKEVGLPRVVTASADPLNVQYTVGTQTRTIPVAAAA